jgi:hypothetical protein
MMRNNGLDERWLARLENLFTLLGLNTANRIFYNVAAINAAFGSMTISVDPQSERERTFHLAIARRLLSIEEDFVRLLDYYHPL